MGYCGSIKFAKAICMLLAHLNGNILLIDVMGFQEGLIYGKIGHRLL